MSSLITVIIIRPSIYAYVLKFRSVPVGSHRSYSECRTMFIPWPSPATGFCACMAIGRDNESLHMLTLKKFWKSAGILVELAVDLKGLVTLILA